MNILVIKSKEGKTNKEALELLKANGFNVYEEDALTVFYEEEAEFRTDRIVDEEDDMAEIFNRLTDEGKQKVYNGVADKYSNDDSAFDYDYLDDIVRDVISEYY